MRHNRGQLPFALARFLGLISGDSPGQDIAETIVPVLSVGDILDSPNLTIAQRVMRDHTSAAVAAKNSGVIALPGPQVVLQIKKIVLPNSTNFPLSTAMTLLTAADIAAATTAFGTTRQFMNYASQIVDAATYTATASQIKVGANGAILGIGMTRLVVPAQDTGIIDFPDPGLLLYGSTEGGIPAIGVWDVTQNEAITVSFVGRQWPLPA